MEYRQTCIEQHTILLVSEVLVKLKTSLGRVISSTESESSPSSLCVEKEVKVPREDMDPPISGLKKSRRIGGLFRFQDGYPSVVVGVSSIVKPGGLGTLSTC